MLCYHNANIKCWQWCIMSVITLRGLETCAEKKIRKCAIREGKSLNRFLVDLIEVNFMGKGEGKTREFNDLDDLIGSLNEEDVKSIGHSVKKQRRTDPELWT